MALWNGQTKRSFFYSHFAGLMMMIGMESGVQYSTVGAGARSKEQVLVLLALGLGFGLGLGPGWDWVKLCVFLYFILCYKELKTDKKRVLAL
jgi:hypothetical protein